MFEIDLVVARIADLNVRLARPLLIGVDGLGGSGKSTFARELADAVKAPVVGMDEFYRVMDEDERAKLGAKDGCWRYFNWEYVRSSVIQPVLRGDRKLSYQVYEWTNSRLGCNREVEIDQVLIVEGVYACLPTLAAYDIQIWIDVPREVATQRVKNRDENEEIWIHRWAAAEDWYAENIVDMKGFDFVFSGETGELTL
ncbi:uridine kinase [Poriferisphaera corsica]|uniref:Uridine kinase n=1 Tax=Poriferisphaera corsica TaxID=2528020 RepID=A0A517YY10_9BACT|nr:AAA family ATPase [Poriferisphaera corsica]QDU35122.1 uridine kinase [Poriferisphaera corsica]